MTNPTAEHIDADWVGLLDPDQELEDIELGFRVSWCLTIESLAGAYTEPDWPLHLLAIVANAAREAHRPMPREWKTALMLGDAP